MMSAKEQMSQKVILLTGRTVEQGVGKEQGKMSKEYQENVAVCFIDPEDMKQLGIEEKTNVLVSTAYGSVVVKAVKSIRKHVGSIFIPYGPWVNSIIDPETHGVGMPSLKGIQAHVKPALNRKVLTITELLEKHYRPLKET
jgi:formylmethanofuran dehydrogenase subunit D